MSRPRAGGPALVLLLAACTTSDPGRGPVIFSTDVGTDVDDAHAPRMREFMKLSGVQSYYAETEATLHDPLAVAALMERIRIRVETGPGRIRTVADPEGPIEIEVVTNGDHGRLSRLVTEAALRARP